MYADKKGEISVRPRLSASNSRACGGASPDVGNTQNSLYSKFAAQCCALHNVVLHELINFWSILEIHNIPEVMVGWRFLVHGRVRGHKPVVEDKVVVTAIPHAEKRQPGFAAQCYFDDPLQKP